MGMNILSNLSDLKTAAFPINVVAPRRSFLEKNRDVVKRFLKAYAEADQVNGKVVALDTKRNLLSTFAGLTVRLTADMLPEAWQSRVVREQDGTYLLSLASYAELERLLAALRESSATIAELSLQEADLEQVFLRIMARHH